jgi:adenylate cyclase
MQRLMARASGDQGGYRDFMDRYRAMAKAVGFQGHLAIADSAN